jgi:hypothetical protein
LERQEKKGNKGKAIIMKQLLAIICGAMLIVAYAQAQTSNTSSTTTTGTNPSTTSMTNDATNTTTTSTTDSSGTVTDYSPGAMITLDPGTGQPVHFIIGKTVQIVTPDGKVIKAADVMKSAKVHVHLVADGNRTVVDKIIVDDAQ